MVTEEISMNHALEEIGWKVLESDLGEYILQVDNDPPSTYWIAPALHKIRRKFAMYLRKAAMKILMTGRNEQVCSVNNFVQEFMGCRNWL